MLLLHMSSYFLVERVPGSALICRRREFTGVEQVTGQNYDGFGPDSSYHSELRALAYYLREFKRDFWHHKGSLADVSQQPM